MALEAASRLTAPSISAIDRRSATGQHPHFVVAEPGEFGPEDLLGGSDNAEVGVIPVPDEGILPAWKFSSPAQFSYLLLIMEEIVSPPAELPDDPATLKALVREQLWTIRRKLLKLCQGLTVSQQAWEPSHAVIACQARRFPHGAGLCNRLGHGSLARLCVAVVRARHAAG